MKQKAKGVDQWEDTVGESPTSPITEDSRSASITVRRQWGRVSILPVA